MEKANNIEKYKEKIIELADKLLEKEKECSYLKELTRVHECKISSLEKQLDDDKRYKDLMDQLEQQDNKITSLIKQRDNWRADCEYSKQCFQAEREARYKLEDEIKVLKGKKKYPCISMNCNDITGESSSLYFCFSYDDRILLANNIPGNISMDKFVIKSCYIDSSKGGLIYVIEYLLPPFTEDILPYNVYDIKFEVSYDLKKVISSCIPRDWNNHCNNKSNKDVKDNYFQRYCFLGVNNRLYVCVSENKYILLDMQPESWIQKSNRWKIWYDDKTRDGLVQIYDEVSSKIATYYIRGNNVKKIIIE